MRCPLVLSYFADEPCQSPLPSWYLFNHVKDLYLFSFPEVYFLSRYVMFIFVCAGANLFFAWVVSANVYVIFHDHLWLQLVFKLIPVAFVVHSSYGVFKHISISWKQRWLRYSPFILCLFQVLSNVAVNSVGNMVSPCHTPLLMLSYCFLCVGGLSLSYWCRYPSGVRWTYLLSPVLEARSVLLEFALSQKLLS